MLQAYYYLVLEGFAFIICFLIYLNLRKKHTLMPDERVFLYLILANMAILCADMITWYTDGRTFPLSKLLLISSNVIYYLLSSAILLLWLLYVSFRIGKKYLKLQRWSMILISLPPLFEIVMSITAPFNGLYFYVDASNVYHRGPLCWTQADIGIAYMLLAAVLAFVNGIRVKDAQEKKESFMLVVFTIFPLLCSIVQSQFFGLPLIWLGTTISFMIFFIQTQNSQISIDALTQLNNRGKFDTYLSQKIHELKKTETLYLVVIDIDKFKSVNDSFGHVEGDEALIALANILSKACQAHKDFSSRYGGDEFTLVCIRSKTETVLPLMEEAERLLSDYNEQSKKPYSLRVSYGIAAYTGDLSVTEEALKHQADHLMYEMKAAHHRELVDACHTNDDLAL